VKVWILNIASIVVPELQVVAWLFDVVGIVLAGT
jgi:hypothetical protein